METALDQHRMILFLLSQGEGAEAELALESHILHMQERVLADLAPAFESPHASGVGNSMPRPRAERRAAGPTDRLREHSGNG